MTSTLVAFSSNSSFAVPLSAAVRSLRYHYTGEIAVCYEDFPVEQRDVIDNAAGANPVRWVPVDSELVAPFPTGAIDKAQWYRLVMPQLMPDVERILYLDADTLTTDSLETFIRTDLQGAPFGAVQNLRAPYVSSTDGLVGWKHISADPGLPYFNSGVLLIDAAQWRTNDFTPAVARQAQEFFELSLRPGSDQDALNAVFAGQWLQLPYRFNQHPVVFQGHGHHHQLMAANELVELRNRPAIVHFIGRAKPWKEPCSHPFTERWRATIADTGFADFTPETRSATDKIAGRVRRATKALLG